MKIIIEEIDERAYIHATSEVLDMIEQNAPCEAELNGLEIMLNGLTFPHYFVQWSYSL